MNSSLTERISCPILPYATFIPKGISLEKVITIRGTLLNKEPYQFVIDLCCGRTVQGEELDNKALHFNPRFIKKRGLFDKAENALVLNSLIDNQWGFETRFHNYFQPNTPFTIKIRVLEHYFSISINEKYLLNYVHRIPYTDISTLYINGAAKIDLIEFDNGSINPNDNLERGPKTLSTSDFYFRNLPVPFAHSFRPGSLDHTKEIILTATPTKNATIFNFNLKRNDDYFFHLRVDFPKKKFNGALVRNHNINNCWASEERAMSKFPFNREKIFELKIRPEFERLIATLDGQTVFTFNYRPGIYLNEVNLITIIGDLIIQKIELKTGFV